MSDYQFPCGCSFPIVGELQDGRPSIIFKPNLENINMDYKNPEGANIEETQVGDMVYKTINADFNLTGTYEQLISFLEELETSLRLVDVVALSLKPEVVVVQGRSNVNIKYAVSIRTYSLK